MLLEWHDVMMLRPLSPTHAVPVLPAVDPLTEPLGGSGMVSVDWFAVSPGRVEELAGQVQSSIVLDTLKDDNLLPLPVT